MLKSTHSKTKIERKFKVKKIILALIFLSLLLFILEPLFRSGLIFALSIFNEPPVQYEQTDGGYLFEPDTQVAHSPLEEAGHAPEPSTLILFLGGITGIIVRFVQKSFKKFKRYMDITLSILGILFTGPLLMLAAILIKLTSKGPAIYRQNRVGQDGNIFGIYKLRTMLVDAEKETGAVWAKKDDPRITGIGRILRKTHIDEIPQLFNVIKGEMSIVGPRPERPEMVMDFKQLIYDYEKRLQVKPGITGFAQVWHKYDETIQDVKKKIKYDLLYIRKMCLWVDLRIMARTFVVVLTGRGAH